jgi:serine/threonine protein kinase
LIGTTLSHFRITAKLGEGGMGEVYRAEDTKLGREVAIKVLPEAVASDPERLARFEREAKVLASLNHSHIAAIYSIESAIPSGRPMHFLVMELAEGEDLGARIARGPVPVDEALPIALQIAEALEAAHEKGIIHRDLKPANVKVGSEGEVKVLDFGLAKALDPAAGTETDSVNPSMSPTLTAQMTQAGVILGTAAYMAPEQARGKTVDKRADIWAFGVVLFEMLTGKQLFAAESVPETLGAIFSREIDLDELPADAPLRLRQLLWRCLERDPRRRLRDIGEARITLEAAPDSEIEAAAPGLPLDIPTWRRWLPWSIATAALAVAVGLALTGSQPDETADSRSVVAAIPIPDPLHFSTSRGPMALSADGSRLAFVVIDATGEAKLAWRSLDSPEVHLLAGSEDASSPFWSPDALSLGFFADQKLKRIDLEGGELVVLAAAPVPEGGSWNREGVIVFAPGAWGQPIRRVNADGGDASVVIDLVPEKKIDYHLRPSFLPDGRRFLFSVLDQTGAATGLYLGSIDEPEVERLTGDIGLHAVYIQPGYLLYWQEGSLRARSFDPETSAVGEQTFRIADRVRSVFPVVGLFAASQNGLLVYLSGDIGQRTTELAWVDRDGGLLEQLAPPSEYYYPRLSHSGRRVVVDQSLPLADLWTFEVGRAIPNRVTYSEVDETLPVWSADDARLYYMRAEGENSIYVSQIASNEDPRLVVANGSPCDVSPDGRFLLFRRDKPGESDLNEDLWTVDLSDGTESVWLATPYAERTGRFSPNGRWIAYAANDSGRFEVYLQRFPELAERIPVSDGGGTTPVWRPDGRELYYWSANGWLMAVPVELSDSPRFGESQPLFKARLRNIGGWNAQYDVSADGQRLLLNRLVEEPTVEPLVLIQNWGARLTEK